MTLKISVELAASVIAGFIREGVTFDAEERGGSIYITFTGGY